MDGYLIPVVNGVAYGLLLFVVAAGLTLAFGAGGVLNLAHGSFYALGAYSAAVLTDGSWVGMVQVADRQAWLPPRWSVTAVRRGDRSPVTRTSPARVVAVPEPPTSRTLTASPARRSIRT
ncbi:MAG: hypothetical protein GEV12_14060 [Micromonosporaceae bacterium]|nr:hypothetical protein [Micromonosporaceae bacterium]